MNTPNPDQARDASSDAEAADLIQEMMGAAADAGKRYQRQFSLAKTLMGREWKLSARALLLVMTGVLLLTAVGATLWLTFNAMLALGLVQLGLHWAWVGSCILLLNSLVLWGLIATIRALLRHISFSRAWDALTLSSNVNSATKPEHPRQTSSVTGAS